MLKILTLLYCLGIQTATCALREIDLSWSDLTNVVYFQDSTLSDRFGVSVKGAGDLNQDGYDDVIIGVSGANLDANSVNEGLIYVIYGNTALTSMNDIGTQFVTPINGFKISDLKNSNQLGISISGAGDFNNDGALDLVAGASGGDGRAYVIFGDKNRNTDVDLSLFNSNTRLLITGGTSFNLGSSVNAAGDINGDSIDDIIISAPSADGLRGYVYIIFGRHGVTSDFDFSVNDDVQTSNNGFRIQGDAQYAQIGISVSAAGDLNGDNIDDIIFGAIYYHVSSSYYGSGKAYVIYGNKSSLPNIDLSQGLNSDQGFTIYSTETGNCLGYSVSKAGDLNDDGISDVIVGAPFSDPVGRTDAGAAYVIFGKKNGPSDINVNDMLHRSQGYQILGANSGDNFGIAVANAEDFNGDKIDDIVIGASMASPTTSRSAAGITYIIYGKRNGYSDIDLADELDETQGFQILGANKIDSLGVSVGSAGDVNQDGSNDLIIGSSYQIGSTYGGGLVYIIFGSPYSFLKLLEGLSTTISITSKVSQGAAIVITAINIADMAMIRLNCLFEMMMYVRYLKLTFPERLQYIFDQPNPELISLAIIGSLSDEIDIKASSNSTGIPEQFEKYGLYSSFLANFLLPILFLLCLLFVLMLTFVFNILTRSSPKAHSISIKFKQVMKWNYLLAFFIGYFSDISLISSLEFRSVSFSPYLGIVSFVLCFLINLGAIAVIVKLTLIIKRIRHEKIRSKDLSEFEKFKDGFKDCQIVYSTLKEDSFLQLAYIIFFAIRLYIFNMIIGYLFEYPLVQIIIINIIELVILGYLGVKRPFKQRIEFVSTISQEAVLQIIHGCALGLTLIETKDIGSEGTRVILGDIIIACYILSAAIATVYIIVTFIVLIRDLYKRIKTKKSLNVETSLQQPNAQDLTQTSPIDVTATNNLIQNQDTTQPDRFVTTTNLEYKETERRDSRLESPGRRLPMRSVKDMKSLNLLRSKAHRNTLFSQNSDQNEEVLDISVDNQDLRYYNNNYESENNVYGRRKTSILSLLKEKEIKKTTRGSRPFHLSVRK